MNQYPPPGGQPPGYPPGQPPGYPPQGGGYPPQGGGYPPQGGGYPPQGGGYPPEGQQPQFGPPMGAPQFGPPMGQFPQPRGGGFMTRALAAVVPILGILGYVGFKVVLPMVTGGAVGGGGKDPTKELAAEGIKIDAADPDAVITAMQKRATRWQSDAKFYSVNVLGLKSDGTVDFKNDSSNMTIEFFSPHLISSFSKKDQEKVIRKYIVNKYKINEEIWGVKKRYENVPGTPMPTCKQAQIGKLLGEKGMKTGTAQVTLDPGFAFATDSLSFNVNVSEPKLHFFVDIDSCKIIKEL